MSAITFLNWPITNWLDKNWAKKEFELRRRGNFILLDRYFPNITHKVMAEKIGMSIGYYIQLRKRYGLKRRTK